MAKRAKKEVKVEAVVAEAAQAAPAPEAQPTVTASIKDYRQLSATEQAAINEFKNAEEELLRVLDVLNNAPPGGDVDADRRWLAIGRTHLEQAFMAINRSIAKPGRIALPADAAAAA